MKKIICSLIIASLMVSCVTRKACERKFPAYSTDSVSIVSNTVTLIRDTTIYVKIPGDTVFASVPVGEVSMLSTGMATSTAWVKDGKLEHRLEQKDSSISTLISGRVRITNSDFTRDRVIQKTQNINKLSGWQWFQIYLGRLFAMILVFNLIWGYTIKHFNLKSKR